MREPDPEENPFTWQPLLRDRYTYRDEHKRGHNPKRCWKSPPLNLAPHNNIQAHAGGARETEAHAGHGELDARGLAEDGKVVDPPKGRNPVYYAQENYYVCKAEEQRPWASAAMEKSQQRQKSGYYPYREAFLL